LEALGCMTAPVTVMDGRIVVGFDRPEFERFLAE
jgi:hypothetical protein